MHRGPQMEAKNKQMQTTIERVFFSQRILSVHKQVVNQCHGGFLRQLLQETTGRLEQGFEL